MVWDFTLLSVEHVSLSLFSECWQKTRNKALLFVAYRQHETSCCICAPSHFSSIMNRKMWDKLSTWNSCEELGSWRGKFPSIWAVMMKMSHLRRRDRIQFALLLSSLPPFSPWEEARRCEDMGWRLSLNQEGLHQTFDFFLISRPWTFQNAEPLERNIWACEFFGILLEQSKLGCDWDTFQFPGRHSRQLDRRLSR